MQNGIDIYQPILGLPLLDWLSQYGYFVLLPLLMIEGRVVGLIASALATPGYLNIFIVWTLMVTAGLLSDTFYYFLGNSGSSFARRFRFTRRIIKRIESSPTGSLAPEFFDTYGARTFFFTKSVPSLSWPLQIVAGASFMNKRKYFTACVTANVVWSSVTAGTGYFMGYLAQQVSIYFVLAFFILVIAVAFPISKWVSMRLIKGNLQR
jgi:membrane protein DedA with SNARE-associated domain